MPAGADAARPRDEQLPHAVEVARRLCGRALWFGGDSRFSGDQLALALQLLMQRVPDVDAALVELEAVEAHAFLGPYRRDDDDAWLATAAARVLRHALAQPLPAATLGARA